MHCIALMGGRELGDSEAEEAKRKIVRAASARWECEHSAYLLSQIGKDFPKEIRALSQGRKLLDVIKAEFPSELALIHRGEANEKVWAVVPSSADEADASRQIPVKDPLDNIRWNSALWAAFRTPLATGRRRAIQQRERAVWFTDLEGDDESPTGTILQLRPEDLPAPITSSSQVSERIKATLEAHFLPLDRFTSGRSAPVQPSSAFVATTGATTLLDELLICLSPGEARRVAVPLDIIQKLYRHPISR